MWGRAGAVWAAGSTGVSAVLYLLDLGTTMSALRTYYLYEFECPHSSISASASSLLRHHDPICAGSIGSGSPSIPFPFWYSLASLLLAHLIYGFIFWLTLDPRQHPLRLAYFLPLIHLYRLLKLFFHTLSCQELKHLTKSQQESNTLFNVIGSCVETIPQFCIQFVIAMQYGEHINGSSDPNLRAAQMIPTNLIVSLVASMLSVSYTTGVAVWSLIENRMPLARRTFYCFLIGCQTVAGMLARAMCVAALSQLSKTWFLISLLIYSTSGIIITWVFIYVLLQDHHEYNCGQGKTKYLRVAHSLGLAVMTRLVGPTYVIVKFSRRPWLLIGGTLSHVFLELIGAALVFLLPAYIKEQQSPCHPSHINLEENEYLTCKVFLGTLFPSLFIFFLTTLQIFCLESGKNARVVPCTFTENVCDTHNNKPTFSKILITNEVDHTSRGCDQEQNSHQMTTTTLFTLAISILFIQKLQKKYVLKRLPLTL